MPKKYTKLEIELYEKLVDILLYFKEFEKSFVERLYSPKKLTDMEMDKLYKSFEDFIRLSKTIKSTKIPKKFLILNKLSEKKKNG